MKKVGETFTLDITPVRVVTELTPVISGRKSFYGKAKVINDHASGVLFLESYNTTIGVIKDGVFYRTWDGESETSARHATDFAYQYGAKNAGNGLKWWRGLKPVKLPQS